MTQAALIAAAAAPAVAGVAGEVIRASRVAPAAPVVNYQGLSPRAIKILSDAQFRSDLLDLVERIITHPTFATIAGSVLVEQLRRSESLNQPQAITLQTAILLPGFMSTLSEAVGSGLNVAKLIQAAKS